MKQFIKMYINLSQYVDRFVHTLSLLLSVLCRFSPFMMQIPGVRIRIICVFVRLILSSFLTCRLLLRFPLLKGSILVELLHMLLFLHFSILLYTCTQAKSASALKFTYADKSHQPGICQKYGLGINLWLLIARILFQNAPSSP